MTTSLGSLMVTAYFVFVHGQDVGTALSIAAMSTIIGMVSDTLLFVNASVLPTPLSCPFVVD